MMEKPLPAVLQQAKNGTAEEERQEQMWFMGNLAFILSTNNTTGVR